MHGFPGGLMFPSIILGGPMLLSVANPNSGVSRQDRKHLLKIGSSNMSLGRDLTLALIGGPPHGTYIRWYWVTQKLPKIYT